MMKKTLVKCPKCKKMFFTEKKVETQCRGDGEPCGHRFDVKENEVEI